MSNYPVPPPAYGQQNPNYQSVNESREPLLGSSSRGGGGAGGFYDQPDQNDLPDDFKVRWWFSTSLELHPDIWLQYGVSVSESSPQIRNAFIRKVYTILREQSSLYHSVPGP